MQNMRENQVILKNQMMNKTKIWAKKFIFFLKCFNSSFGKNYKSVKKLKSICFYLFLQQCLIRLY